MARSYEHDVGIGFKVGGLGVTNPANRVVVFSHRLLDLGLQIPERILVGVGDGGFGEGSTLLQNLKLVVDDFFLVYEHVFAARLDHHSFNKIGC